MRWRAVVAVAAVGVLAASAPAAAQPKERFFGVVPQAPLGAADYERMQGVVGEIRMPFFWAQVEPQPGRYEFSVLDEAVGDAAAHGIRVLPFVFGSPSWVGDDLSVPPLANAVTRRAWADFLRLLVNRYGPGGGFWKGRQAVEPIRRWQIWNEPNYPLFWLPKPAPRRYAALLRLSASAIRREDPGARILAAGVAPIEDGMLPWEFLRRMYRVRGVERYFDVVALHPYAGRVRTTEYEIRQVRRVMARAGDGSTPLQLSEIGVASDGAYPNSFDKGPRGQARFLRRAFGLFARNRARWRLAGVDWFAWQDGTHDPHCVFCQFSGLVDVDGRPKPAWWAFRSAVAEAEARVVR